MLSEINICIIVPCYNEENNFHIEEYEKIISEYYIDAWGNKFHATHKENGVFCNTCSRIISKGLTSGGFQFNDGRHMCKLCSISMINSDHLKIKSINNVFFLKVIG